MFVGLTFDPLPQKNYYFFHPKGRVAKKQWIRKKSAIKIHRNIQPTVQGLNPTIDSLFSMVFKQKQQYEEKEKKETKAKHFVDELSNLSSNFSPPSKPGDQASKASPE